MNISEVRVKLVGSDILSIINEFVKIEGLLLKNVFIDDGIILEGSIRKGIKANFFIKAEIIECVHNKIIARIVKVRILNLGFFRIVRSFALKRLAKAFEKYGIDSDKDKVIIDINTILKDVNFIDLNVDEIFIKRSEVWVETSDVNISIAGNLVKKIYAVEEANEEEDNIASLDFINKVEDNYSRGRKRIEERLSETGKRYKEYIFILPDIISLVYRLLKDKRVPIKTKLIMSSAIAYTTLPIGIIPNSIPFIGEIDDIGVILFALNKILKDIPLSVIVENWQGDNNLILVLRKGIEYLVNFTNARNVEKLYTAIEELSAL
jgi:uncharacterized membrane protein YkvA (DUF1232 family)